MRNLSQKIWIVAGFFLFTGSLVFFYRMPTLKVGYVRVPSGYSQAVVGEFATYNNKVLKESEIAALVERYPDAVFLVWQKGKCTKMQGVNLHNASFYCIAIAKDGRVEGFAFQRS